MLVAAIRQDEACCALAADLSKESSLFKAARNSGVVSTIRHRKWHRIAVAQINLIWLLAQRTNARRSSLILGALLSDPTGGRLNSDGPSPPGLSNKLASIFRDLHVTQHTFNITIGLASHLLCILKKNAEDRYVSHNRNASATFVLSLLSSALLRHPRQCYETAPQFLSVLRAWLRLQSIRFPGIQRGRGLVIASRLWNRLMSLRQLDAYASVFLVDILAGAQHEIFDQHIKVQFLPGTANVLLKQICRCAELYFRSYATNRLSRVADSKLIHSNTEA